MISFNNKEAVINNLICNKLEIRFVGSDDETITETNIASESMQLKQSICDDNKLKFGGCIASEFKINLINTEDRVFTNDLVGKWICVRLSHYYPTDEDILPSKSLYPSSTIYPGKVVKSTGVYIFCGYIDSAKVDKNDKNMRNIVAYDLMAKLYERDATSLLMQYFKSTATNGFKWLKNLFYLCMSKEYNGFMDIPYVSSDVVTYMDEVINEVDELTVGRYEPENDDWIANNSTISFGEVLKSICELLGVFGVIKPNQSRGIFCFYNLKDNTENYDFYEDLYTEEYNCDGYTNFMILNGNEDRDDKITLFQSQHTPDGATVNTYDLSENVLAWQKWDTLDGTGKAYINNMLNGTIGERFYNSQYTPITATLDGRIWVEIGDKINIKINKTNVDGSYMYDENGDIVTETIESYVLSRTLTGIQALTDKIEAKGEKQ